MSRVQTSRSNYRFDYRRNGTLTRAAFNQSGDRSSNPRAQRQRERRRERPLAGFVTYSQRQVIYIFLISGIISAGAS